MNTLVFSVCAVAVLVLGGCAQAPLTRADVDGRLVCNTDYMDQVERTAQRQHTEVRWVNCPLARLVVVPS